MYLLQPKIVVITIFCQARLFFENPIALGYCDLAPTNALIGGWGHLGHFGVNPYLHVGLLTLDSHLGPSTPALPLDLHMGLLTLNLYIKHNDMSTK